VKKIDELLGQLKLSGIKETLEFRIIEAAKSSLSYEELLRLLLEDELLHRSNKRALSLKHRANFNDAVILADFDADPKRGISKMLIKELQTLHFMKAFENIYLYGGTGAGKSYLSQAIGQQACLLGLETKFISLNYLFEQYRFSERAGTTLNFLKKIASYKLLILDDIGLRKLTHEEAIILYQILEDRYRKQSTIVTTQLRPEGLKDLFEDPVLAEAIVDRIKSNAHVIEIKGESYRKKQNPKKKMSVEITQ
jgi:DNA replication protein DnaC